MKEDHSVIIIIVLAEEPWGWYPLGARVAVLPEEDVRAKKMDIFYKAQRTMQPIISPGEEIFLPSRLAKVYWSMDAFLLRRHYANIVQDANKDEEDEAIDEDNNNNNDDDMTLAAVKSYIYQHMI
jgi:hypothetical protein